MMLYLLYIKTKNLPCTLLTEVFTTVDHFLVYIEFDSAACDWFKNYPSDIYQGVKMGGVNSEYLPISKGVPQGSIFGPLIFYFIYYCFLTSYLIYK